MKRNRFYLDQAGQINRPEKVLKNCKKHHPFNLVFKELNQTK